MKQKVEFVHKNGRVKMMRLRDAELLRRLGRGTYRTADMRPQEQAVVTSAKAEESAAIMPVVEPVAIEVDDTVESDGLDDLDADQLHALAKERGVKVHHASGADKVRAALREAQ